MAKRKLLLATHSRTCRSTLFVERIIKQMMGTGKCYGGNPRVIGSMLCKPTILELLKRYIL